MSLLPFGGPQFNDPIGFQDFALSNLVAHSTYADFLARKGMQIDGYTLSENVGDQDWMAAHAQIHNQIDAALGIPGTPNMDAYDLKDETQFNDWMDTHQAMHQAEESALGIY
jgi:hypothetical protein